MKIKNNPNSRILIATLLSQMLNQTIQRKINYNLLMSGHIIGYKVYKNDNLTVMGDPYQIRRNWKERLFTWPWRPFQASKTVIPLVPSEEVIIDRLNHVIHMHSEIYEKLRDALNEKKETKR